MKSMTGFGRAKLGKEGREYLVEIQFTKPQICRYYSKIT